MSPLPYWVSLSKGLCVSLYVKVTLNVFLLFLKNWCIFYYFILRHSSLEGEWSMYFFKSTFQITCHGYIGMKAIDFLYWFFCIHLATLQKLVSFDSVFEVCLVYMLCFLYPFFFMKSFDSFDLIGLLKRQSIWRICCYFVSLKQFIYCNYLYIWIHFWRQQNFRVTSTDFAV